MSATDIQVLALAIQNPDFEQSGQAHWTELPRDITFQQNLDNSIQTISANDAPTDSDISGLLYFPKLTAEQFSACPQANSTEYVPRNITHLDDLPANYELIALAPWFTDNQDCTFAFLEAAEHDEASAMIVYQPSNSSSSPPSDSDPSWSLDGGAWKKKFEFPVYAVPGVTGASWMLQLSAYNGNATQVPRGDELLDRGLVRATDFVRLIADVSTSGQGGIPSLWVFLLMVVAILVIIIAFTSGLMHCIARRRRNTLRRRVIAGEVDLEALGIKRLRVPREVLDKMPKYEYTGSAPTPSVEAADPIAAAVIVQRGTDTSKDTSTTAAAPTKLYHQQTCAICLDDFVSSTVSAPSSHLPREAVPNDGHEKSSTPQATETSEATANSDARPTSAPQEPSIVRELPCGHIFHADCVDPFLTTHSSLCPLCKKSALPPGFVPKNITNLMVRRERQVRTLRGRGIRVFNGNSREVVRSSIAAGEANRAAGRDARTPMERIWNQRGRLSLPRGWLNFHLRASPSPSQRDSELQNMERVGGARGATQGTGTRSNPGETLARSSQHDTPGNAAENGVGAGTTNEHQVPVVVVPPTTSALSQLEAQDDAPSRRPPWWRNVIRKAFPVA